MEPYVQELIQEIITHNLYKEGDDIGEVIKEAHRRRKAFLIEMMEAQTERAKIARTVLTAQIYSDIKSKQIEKESMRAAFNECTMLYGTNNYKDNVDPETLNFLTIMSKRSV